MKLRIKGNSLRLRLTPSELAGLLQSGRVEETIYFAPVQSASLTYAVEHNPQASGLSIRYLPENVTIVVPSAEVERWAGSSEVGIYDTLGSDLHPLEVSIEKDFACLDKDDAENADTFPNPHQGAAC